MWRAVVLSGLTVGCCHEQPHFVATTRPAAARLSVPTVDGDLHAAVDPPVGWRPDPVKLTDHSRHQVWVSPRQTTAYGVVTFQMPLPMGTGVALWGVLARMKQVAGEAELVERRDDPVLPGIRFVADGGPYRIRGNLTTDGTRGWMVYAGTRRGQPIAPTDLTLAEQAREATRVDLP